MLCKSLFTYYIAGNLVVIMFGKSGWMKKFGECIDQKGY